MSFDYSYKYQPKGAVTKQIMELPRHKNGEVDWNTLGNMLVAYDLGEVLCASYVDQLYGMEDPGFEALTDWRFLYKEKDVIVLTKQLHPIQCYMGRIVIDLPASVIHGFLGINESALHYDRFLVESKLIKCLRDETNIKDVISYMKHESNHCLVKTKRDFVFYTRWEAMNDGKCVMSGMSIDYPDCPPVSGVTRGQLRPGTGWVLEPYQGDPNRTLVSYIVHVDLITLPPLITKRVMRRIPLSVYYLKEHLLRTRPSPPPHLHTLTPLPHHTSNKQPELPTSPQIPTPMNHSQQDNCNLSSLPMESNPLYQSSSVFMSSTRMRTQSQESWRCKGLDNDRPTRQVSTVPEEDELAAADSEEMGRIQAELDTSHGFPAPFEFTTSGRDASLVRVVNQDKWLMVHGQSTDGPQQLGQVNRINEEKLLEESSEVHSSSSQGNEWTVASSNNE